MLLSEAEPNKSTSDDYIRPDQTNLKISVATKSNTSWSKTFDLNGSVLKNEGAYYQYWILFRFIVLSFWGFTLNIIYLTIVHIPGMDSVYTEQLNLQNSRQVGIPIKEGLTKFYFLATGWGCATLQVTYNIQCIVKMNIESIM